MEEKITEEIRQKVEDFFKDLEEEYDGKITGGLSIFGYGDKSVVLPFGAPTDMIENIAAVMLTNENMADMVMLALVQVLKRDMDKAKGVNPECMKVVMGRLKYIFDERGLGLRFKEREPETVH